MAYGLPKPETTVNQTHCRPDKAFALGGFEVEIGEDFNREHRNDGFPRDEYMFFTKGGMRLLGDDGTVVEAGPGEMLFIPKGWCGTRLITGDELMQKFSVVYSPTAISSSSTATNNTKASQ